MSRPIEYPLNPTDHILLAAHESLRRRGYCGLNVVLIADLQGPLEPGRLAAAVRRLGSRHPALSGRIRYSRLLRRACWRIDADTDLAQAIEYDYRPMDAAADDFDQPIREALNDSLDPTRGPHLRLVHLEPGAELHRLGLRWPHHLMDLEGAHALLRDLHAILSGDEPRAGSDPAQRPPPPYPYRFPVSSLQVWQGRWRYTRCCGAHQPRLVEKPETQCQAANFELRRYSPAFTEQFKAAARARTSPGPQLYTRYLLTAIARTYWMMCHKRGRPRDRYLFSYVVPTPRQGGMPASEQACCALRPALHGNWLTIPWVILAEGDLADWTSAEAAVSRQLADYIRRHHDEADWHMLRALQRWPFPAVRAFMDHQMPSGAAGFTNYRFDDSVTRLGEARITNLSAIGTMNCHPGWIVGHSMFGGGMSIAMTYFEDYVDSASAREFLDRLEQCVVQP